MWDVSGSKDCGDQFWHSKVRKNSGKLELEVFCQTTNEFLVEVVGYGNFVNYRGSLKIGKVV